MIQFTRAGAVAACCCLALATPLLAAEPAATNPAAKCLSDLKSYDGQMENDGYWFGGEGFGFGFPISGYGYGYGYGYPAGDYYDGYRNVRPGYEVRTLLASANILAHQGQQQACEDVLATARTVYGRYLAELKSGKVPKVNVPGWRAQLIASAQPVGSSSTPLRTDQLVGTDVRNPGNDVLGSVADIVISPKTGTLAYLVLARGGIFGFDQSYIPVPWANFRITPSGNLLVLDISKATLEAAPHVDKDQFAANGQFAKESDKVDSYWKTHLAAVGSD